MENEDDIAATAPEDVATTSEMPLFPLDVVLFPQMPLKLHIFEERYKEMIGGCLDAGRVFGIVLVTGTPDAETPASPTPARGAEQTRSVGCSARIAHVERMADGRMNILVIGEERFRIVDTHELRSFRTGIVVPLPDRQGGSPEFVGMLAGEVRDLLRDFLTEALSLAGQQSAVFDLPEEPEALSFTAARVLPIPNGEKQELLETTSTNVRLRSEKDLLQREIARIREVIRQTAPEQITLERFAAYRCSN